MAWTLPLAIWNSNFNRLSRACPGMSKRAVARRVKLGTTMTLHFIQSTVQRLSGFAVHVGVAGRSAYLHLPKQSGSSPPLIGQCGDRCRHRCRIDRARNPHPHPRPGRELDLDRSWSSQAGALAAVRRGPPHKTIHFNSLMRILSRRQWRLFPGTLDATGVYSVGGSTIDTRRGMHNLLLLVSAFILVSACCFGFG